MKQGVWKRVALTVAIVGALGVAACGNNSRGGSAPQTIRIDGSSTVYPLSEAVAEAFRTEGGGHIRVSVGESGTGGGFGRFCRNETEVSDASRPILANEIAECAAAGVSYVEVPVAFDGITVVVNQANPVTTITMDELRTMWAPAAEGQVTNWNQVNSGYPNLPLVLFGAGTASGTFDFFTEAVMGEAKSSRTDYTPSEDDNVTVQGVLNNEGGVGYFGVAYYEQNKERLNALTIDGGDGPIEPTADAIASGLYPLARPMFVYFNADALRRPAFRQFALFYLENVGRLAPDVGYVALPESAYEAYKQRILEVQTGTAFGGEQDVGASIDEVLARPLASELESELESSGEETAGE